MTSSAWKRKQGRGASRPAERTSHSKKDTGGIDFFNEKENLAMSEFCSFNLNIMNVR
jgi:hypothetical protein